MCKKCPPFNLQAMPNAFYQFLRKKKDFTPFNRPCKSTGNESQICDRRKDDAFYKYYIGIGQLLTSRYRRGAFNLKLRIHTLRS